MFCPGVFSRFILASLYSFVKARIGGPWQITGKLRARWGSQRGQGRTPSGTLPRQVKQGAAVFLVILNTPRPSSLAIATSCFSALALSRAKINTPCRCTPSGSSPAGGVFRASFGLHTGKTGDAIPITAAPFFFCWGIDDHQSAVFIHQ